jgi:hypothetical protein
MRSLLFLAVLSPVASAADFRLHRAKLPAGPALVGSLPRPLKEKKVKRSFVEEFFRTIDGGDMNGFGHPDGIDRKPENPLHTLTIRWQLHF